MEQISNWLPLDSVRVWLMTSGVQMGLIIVVSVFLHTVIVVGGRRLLRLSLQSHMRTRSKIGREKRVETLAGVLSKTSGLIIFLAALLMILIELGINVTPILTGAGIAGIAIGFGAQDLVKNIFHGIFILLEDQYSEGDVVRIAGIAGVVEEFDLRRTVLRDLDGVQHHIPNGEVTTASNMTKVWSGINLNLTVDYDTNLKKAREVIDKTGEQLKRDFPDAVLEAPTVAGVEAFGDSAIVIKVLGKAQAGKQWELARAYREAIKSQFDKAGIEIPYPHQVEISKKK